MTKIQAVRVLRACAEVLQETDMRIEALIVRGDLASEGDAVGNREEKATRGWQRRARKAAKRALELIK